jgi:TPR repeat protein
MRSYTPFGPRDWKVALELYQPRCQAGALADCDALHEVETRREWHFMGGPQGTDEARSACREGDSAACAEWARRDFGFISGFDYRGNEVLEALDSACSAKHPLACALLGRVYRTGSRVEADLSRAREFFTLSCAAPAYVGCWELAPMLVDGSGGDADAEAARALLQAPCERGEAASCLLLARYLVDGVGGAADSKLARELVEPLCVQGELAACRRVAELDCAEEGETACLRYARYLHLGRGGPSNWAKARELYERRCTEGSARACTWLGVMLQREHPSLEPTWELRSLDDFFRADCEAGHASACAILGSFGGFGSDSARQPDSLRACELGVGSACLEASERVRYAEDASLQDPVKREQLLERGCALAHARSCHELGFVQEQGNKKDQGRRTLQKACELEDLEVCFYLSYVQSGTMADVERACRGGVDYACDHWFRQSKGLDPADQAAFLAAIEEGCTALEPVACFLKAKNMGFGRYGQNGELKQSVSLMRQACEGGLGPACTGLEMLLSRSYASDPLEVREYAIRACRGGEQRACEQVSEEYAYGRIFAAEPWASVGYGLRACSPANLWNCRQLPLMLRAYVQENGDAKRAYAFFAAACEAGDLLGCREQARARLEGVGVEADEVEAGKLYAAACDAGDGRSCFEAGAVLQFSVPPNLTQAKLRYEQGCALGELEACVSLSFLDEEDELSQQLGRVARVAEVCEQGIAEACHHAGLLASVTKDVDEAVAHFESGCALGFAASCRNAGILLHKPQASRAKALFEKACAVGDPDSCAFAAGDETPPASFLVDVSREAQPMK